MRLVVIGNNFPGRTFCDRDGTTIGEVHVGIQIGKSVEQVVAGDAVEARWEAELRTVVDVDGAIDFRGPAVYGVRGERFVYLSWGASAPGGTLHMFRRAKLMLHRIDAAVIAEAITSGTLIAHVHLTDAHGAPRCARVDPPAITWTAA